MIAASAFIHNAKLISNNNKDFAWITFNFSYRGQPLSYVNPIKDTIAYASFIKSFELPNLPDADNLQKTRRKADLFLFSKYSLSPAFFKLKI